jgi:hypothetical protein
VHCFTPDTCRSAIAHGRRAGIRAGDLPAALCSRHEILQKRLGIAKEQMVLCGMALGYADPDAVVNTFLTERMALEEFVTFVEEVQGE